MVSTLRARFDGRSFVPEGPVTLAEGTEVELTVRDLNPSTPAKPPLQRLAEKLSSLPPLVGPADAASQHDHYLYGVPKKDLP